jgi:16S rRNA U516 pseudouridylate synthase RsuA-like enzyme
MSSSSKGAERLQKLIAQAGIASRRTAEEWIRDGLVTVNGKVAALGDKAELGQDAIKVKGKLLSAPSQRVYYLIYKPKHVIAMVAEDEEGRTTLKNLIPRIKERVFTVGRMDYAGEGAILLTNDGELTQQILKSKNIRLLICMCSLTLVSPCTNCKFGTDICKAFKSSKSFLVRIIERIGKSM